MVISIAVGYELALSGRLDASSASEMREALHTAIDAGAGDLIVDVSGVDLVDATGLGVLLGAHRRAGRAGRRLVLHDASARLVRGLRLARLHRVFALVPAAH
jgi:anti-anti-sigma factor